METYKKDVVYETIIASIIKKEVSGFLDDFLDRKHLYQIDVSLKPLTVAGYVEFEACCAIKENRWSVTGLMDRYGKITFGDLTCDGKLIYRFY